MPKAKKATVYHNPRCSKSRQTLALLEENGVQPEVVEYLLSPPSATRVEELIGMLGIEPHDLLRKKEAPYEELGLDENSSKEEIARAIAKHPILLERPIVVVGKKARLGRPPENVLEIL